MLKHETIVAMVLVFALFSILFIPPVYCQHPAPSVVAITENDTVFENEVFKVDIIVYPDGEEIYACQLALRYDETRFEAISIEKGSFLSQDGANTLVFNKEIESGVVHYAESRSDVQSGVVDTGILASVEFNVKTGVCSGQSPIVLEHVKIADPDEAPIDVTTTNCEMLIISNTTTQPDTDGQQDTSSTSGILHSENEVRSTKSIDKDIKTQKPVGISTSSKANVSVIPYETNVTSISNFTINVTVEPNGNEVYSSQFDLHFDVNKLEATEVVQGAFLSQDGASTSVFINEINNTIGRIRYAEYREDTAVGVTDEGALAVISFQVKPIGSGERSELALLNVTLGGTPPTFPTIPVVTNNGFIITAPISPPPTPTPTPTPPQKKCLLMAIVSGDEGLSDDLDLFRRFRDEMLITNPFGKAFTKMYYLASPPIAEMVSENEQLRTGFKIVLFLPLDYILKIFYEFRYI